MTSAVRTDKISCILHNSHPETTARRPSDGWIRLTSSTPSLIIYWIWCPQDTCILNQPCCWANTCRGIRASLVLPTDRRTELCMDHITLTSACQSSESARWSDSIYVQASEGIPKRRPLQPVEFGNLHDVAGIDEGDVFHFRGDGVEPLVHLYSQRVPVVDEADEDNAVLFWHEDHVDIPSGREVWEKRHG